MEELSTIDTSIVEAMEAATAELETVDRRLDKLEERRDSVSQEVYERVHADYSARKATLEKEIAPLKEKARVQYDTVKKALQALEQSARELALEKEEILLRQELGEYTEEELSTRIGDVEERIGETAGSLAEAERLRSVFALAFREESAGETTVDTPPPLELDEPAGTEEAPSADLEEEAPDGGDEDSPVEPPPLEGTQPVEMSMAAGSEDPARDETVFIRWPKLVGQATDGSTVEYPVTGSQTTLGTDPENDIALSGKKVSKHHAAIVLVEDGYEIKDLESSAGTLVNGVQISSWKLSNGDSIQLGDVVLVFMES